MFEWEGELIVFLPEMWLVFMFFGVCVRACTHACMRMWLRFWLWLLWSLSKRPEGTDNTHSSIYHPSICLSLCLLIFCHSVFCSLHSFYFSSVQLNSLNPGQVIASWKGEGDPSSGGWLEAWHRHLWMCQKMNAACNVKLFEWLVKYKVSV